MKTLFTNILNVFRHYKWATTLNLLGLSLAFTTCYVITQQAWYEFTFNRSINDHERIYQLGHISPENRSGNFVRPLLTQIFTQSPHIENGGMIHFRIDDVLTSSQENRDKFYPAKTRMIDADYTRVFGFKWLSGGTDTFEKVENQVFIPASLAQKLYGSVDVVGKTICSEDVEKKIQNDASETDYTIGGVYQDFPNNTSISNCIYSYLGDIDKNGWGNGNYSGFVKLTSPEHTDAVLQSITYPEGYFERWEFAYGANFKEELLPLDDLYFDPCPIGSRSNDMQHGDKTVTYLLIGIAALILLIASINFVNFSLALAPTRIRSINTQKVLGASVLSLQLDQLKEAMTLSFLAFIIALIEIQLLRYTPLTNLFIADISLQNENLIPIIACGIMALMVGLLAGIWPAIYTTSMPMAIALKGAFNLSPKGVKIRNLLIGFQFTTALVLLTVALFFFLQNRYMLSAPLGVDKERIVVIDFNPYSISLEQQSALTTQLKSYAGAESVATSDKLLFNAKGSYQGWDDIRVLIVEGDFVQTLGIPIREGRNFRPEDENKVLLNESARQKNGYKLGDFFRDYEVIGFIPDLKIFSLRETSSIPFGLFLNTYNSVFYMKLKAGISEQDAIAFAQQAINKIIPFSSDISARMFSDVIEERYQQEQNQFLIISLFCILTLFIAVMGVFGLVIFETQSRRKEIALCKIHGASSGQVIWLFNRTYLLILLFCFVVSIPLAWYVVQRWLEGFIDHIPIYGWVFGIALFIVLLITVATISLQCWRTANSNPIDSIKNE